MPSRLTFICYLFTVYLNAAVAGLGIGLIAVEMEHRVCPPWIRNSIILFLLMAVTYPIAFTTDFDREYLSSEEQQQQEGQLGDQTSCDYYKPIHEQPDHYNNNNKTTNNTNKECLLDSSV
jgi:hypothetical protein